MCLQAVTRNARGMGFRRHKRKLLNPIFSPRHLFMPLFERLGEGGGLTRVGAPQLSRSPWRTLFLFTSGNTIGVDGNLARRVRHLRWQREQSERDKDGTRSVTNSSAVGNCWLPTKGRRQRTSESFSLLPPAQRWLRNVSPAFEGASVGVSRFTFERFAAAHT